MHWEDLEGSGGEGDGRGDRDGEQCKSMADSFQCMTKPTTIKKKIKEWYATAQIHLKVTVLSKKSKKFLKVHVVQSKLLP